MSSGDGDLDDLLREAVAVVDASSPPEDDANEDQPPAVEAVTQAEPEVDKVVKLNFEEELDEAVSEEVEGLETDSALAQLQAENEKLTTRHDELSSRHLRLMADFDNFRKRVVREAAVNRRYAGEPVLRELIEVMDNLDRAVAAGDENGTLLKEGVSMIRVQLQSLLGRFGASAFDSVGSAFDPENQEAVANVPHDAVEGTVIEELQKGYNFHDRLLRAARVVVSAGNLDNGDETLPNGAGTD